jgi:precorrin-6x reductase
MPFLRRDYAMLGEPGANWVGNWYARNLKIFANLVRLADNPGDRVLVVYGQSHVFPLRQYAEQSGAFKVVSRLQVLQPPAR